MRLRSASLTDIGKVREENEDRFLCDDGRRLYAVADGIGGLAGGAQAAEEAIAQLAALAAGQPADGDWDFQSLFAEINRRVATVGRSIDTTFGIGTTLTVVRLRDAHLNIAHVGDSCAFLRRGERFEKLTHDHTMENEMRARSGHSLVFLNPRTRNALTRCIGQPVTPKAELLTLPVADGDRLLVCSDGITRYLHEQEISEAMVRAAEPVDALAQLVTAANDRGGHDNVTGVAVFIDAL
jgi:serine/threonine protein phosphatase PrpC